MAVLDAEAARALGVSGVGRGVATIVTLLVVLLSAPALAAPSCTAACPTRMAACRAERCPDATRKDRRHCRDTCRAVTGCAAGGARVRATLAYVVTECRSGPGGWTGRQRLEIRRGECPPVTVMEIDASDPVSDPLGVCRIFGEVRQGFVSVGAGSFQRLAMSPDGKNVVFDLDYESSIPLLAGPRPPNVESGTFLVQSDGRPRRLRSASRAPKTYLYNPPFPPYTLAAFASSSLVFTADGRRFVYTDLAPGPDGVDAVQAMAFDLDRATVTQLTHFANAAQIVNGFKVFVSVADARTIVVNAYDRVEKLERYTVRPDGTDLRLDPLTIVAPPGAAVVPNFRVIGASGGQVLTLGFPDRLAQPGGLPLMEAFVKEGRNLLQVTGFGSSDLLAGSLTRDRQRVILTASADPLGTNPPAACQLFTVDALGGNVKQLTYANPGMPLTAGCYPASAPECSTGTGVPGVVDPATGAILFDSSCDLLGSNPMGQQLFAVRPDGTGLRQLTNFRPMTVEPDGTVDVELPGPFAYSTR